jgi:hypothetical protein
MQAERTLPLTPRPHPFCDVRQFARDVAVNEADCEESIWHVAARTHLEGFEQAQVCQRVCVSGVWHPFCWVSTLSPFAYVCVLCGLFREQKSYPPAPRERRRVMLLIAKLFQGKLTPEQVLAARSSQPAARSPQPCAVCTPSP